MVPGQRGRQDDGRHLARPAYGPPIRFLPRCFAAYIASSTASISWSRISPSSGQATSPMDTLTGTGPPRSTVRIAATPWRIFSATDERPGRVCLRQEHHELVTAEARRGVDPANAVTDDVGHAGQNVVTGAVPVRVVDRLEVVEVCHQEAEAAPIARPTFDLALDRGDQVGPVCEPGERVGRGEAHGRQARSALLAATTIAT